MPKFAVYYVPDINTEFYRLGSEILGYDVRRSQDCSISPELKFKLNQYDQLWTKAARPYGFHLTIGDSIEFMIGDLYQIESELEAILKCFAPSDIFQLRKHESDFIPNWGEPIVLRYDPNDHLRTLHTLVVSRINTLGIGSGYLRSYLNNPDKYAQEPHNILRTLKFYSPFVFSDFKPHFSLFNPYTGSDRDSLVANLTELFDEFTEFTINSICLMVQRDPQESWSIYREFSTSSSS